MKKLKIAFLCIYSHPSICGVWSRVSSLAEMLVKKGHRVDVFSTNIIKGTDRKSSSFENYHKVNIHRFSPGLSFGENVKFWDFSREIEKLNPDIIIAEVYRHPHTALALKIAKKLGKPCFLVTHAPFVEPELRGKLGNIIVNMYDKIYGRKILKKFDKIIIITKWEVPYLIKIGVEKDKLLYIPNGIADEFFKIKRRIGKGILFLGRIAEIKDIETLIYAVQRTARNYPDVKLRIVGPAEEDYKKKLIKLIRELNLDKNIEFLPAIYDLTKKIKLIDSAEIFVLPSKREAMPQSLIEAMSRGKIVIASDNKGASEIISNRNGFLFPISDSERLSEIINLCLQNKDEKRLNKIRKNAVSKSENFRWSRIFDKFYKTLQEYA